MTSEIQNQEAHFFDYYDFLGIPPAAPPNLIYLAILKIEKSLKNKAFNDENYVADVKKNLGNIYDRLLSEEEKRLQYEKEWLDYYFPRDQYQTNIKSMKLNSHNSTLLSTGLKEKSAPLVKEPKKNEIFDYSNDFSYLMMCDRPKERNVFFLDTEQEIHLPPYSDYIHFKKDQFFLSTHGEVKVSIINDALGKHVICSTASKEIPLHIGDRMEFESGTRLILRGFYTKPATNSPSKKWGIHLVQENVILPLEEHKNYVFGRNTSDIRSLSFDEDLFCFVNIGRRERSISRQNFQMFHHAGNWYLKDLGSRYGTTLDLDQHNKFETLIGGSIMKLEIGRIRLGYDKSYLIDVNEIDKLEKQKSVEAETYDYTTIYDIPLFQVITMRYFFLLAISIALLFAQQQETTIISLEKQRYVAMTKNDQQFLHKILGDDLTFIHANGAVESKTLFLQRLKSKDLIYHSIEVKDLKVKMYANCAVVIGVSNIEAQGGKQKVSLNLRFTTVYVRSKEKEWKVVAYQSTRIMQMDNKSQLLFLSYIKDLQ